MFELETYALLAPDENYVVMAVIAHNRTEKDVYDILKELYEDTKYDEESTFIFDWL